METGDKVGGHSGKDAEQIKMLKIIDDMDLLIPFAM